MTQESGEGTAQKKPTVFPVGSEEVEESKSKLDKESAELEFNRFVELMALDLDESTLDDEDKKGLRENKRVIVNALLAGSLVINDKGEPIFTPQRDSGNTHPVTFHEPNGAALMEMDRKADGHNVGKMVVVMANVTATNPGRFARYRQPDLKICMAVMMLYLG